ncbi:HAAS signaling domain-containing protein [Micromonospora sp. NPDC047620]|uniref:HAAS signaling domain-containing protein n=1 Tax=Micromonospora sp. NPDC047620 TaxID=3364251 RepID=UPI003719FFE4
MTVTEQEIADYVARVRAALADLPPAHRDELTEDLPEHLAEVAVEAGGSLVERLGAPEAYAAELRAAAGVGAVAGGRRLDRRLGAVVDRLRARARRWDVQLGPPLGYATASEFLRLLRPAWWVLRGYLAAMLVTVATTGDSFGVLPELNGSALAGLVLLAGSVLASIWLGHHTPGLSRPKRRLLHAGTAVLVLFGLVGLADMNSRVGSGDFGYEQISVDDRYSHVRDVYVYDREGRLVENARLFDQNGDPIRLGYPHCPDGRDPNGVGNPLLRPYPYCPDQAPFAPFPPAATPPAPGLPPLAPTASADPSGPVPTGSPTAGPTAVPTAEAPPATEAPAATPAPSRT